MENTKQTPTDQGSSKLKLSITRMKKIRTNIKAGDTNDHATSAPIDKKPWGLR